MENAEEMEVAYQSEDFFPFSPTFQIDIKRKPLLRCEKNSG